MVEYIERDAALNFEVDSVLLAPGALQPFMDGMAFYADHIKRIPAADVALVRHGRWASVFDIGTVCNQCGYDIEQHGFDVRTDGEPNYCPNCGARMDGDGDV